MNELKYKRSKGALWECGVWDGKDKFSVHVVADTMVEAAELAENYVEVSLGKDPKFIAVDSVTRLDCCVVSAK